MIFGMPTLMAGRRRVEGYARLWARLSLALLDHICHLKVEFRGLQNLPEGPAIVAAKHQSFLDVEFRGLQNLPEGPAIVAAKHQSFLDVVALLLRVRGFTFVYKRELGLIPLFGLYLRRSEQIAIDRAKRGSTLPQVIAAAKQIFAGNRRLVIFPEGTRRAAGAPPLYKAGVARIAQETGVACVPVALNSGLFWRRRGFMRRAGTVVVEFLEPIQPGLDKESRGFMRRAGTVVVEFLEPIQPGLDKESFMRLLETRIEQATHGLVAEALAKDPALAASVPQLPVSSA